MKKRAILDKLGRFFKFIYLKLFRINDTPQKVAIGLGLGVFFGVLPGLGPIAALFSAFLFRVNRAGALLGSLLTNTWLSIPVFLISVKAGAAITGTRYQDLASAWNVFIKDFHWRSLLELSAYKIVGPILTGYLAVSLVIGIASYAAALIALRYFKDRRARPLHL